MAQTIKLKNSGTSGNTPSSLVHGELALNYADGKLFYKNSSNSIVELSTAGSFLPLSGGTLTGNLLLGTNSLAAKNITLNASGSNNPQITFNNNDFSNFDWFFNQDDSGRLIATVTGTSGAEMQLFSDGSDYTNATLHVGGSRVITANAGVAISTGAISSGAITADTGGASQNVLNIGGSSATNYTIQRWLTSAHSGNEAYILAYGASHSSEAGNFAIKNLEANSDIFFELAGSVEPLRLTSAGATFAGSVNISGDLNIASTLAHTGDLDTYFQFNAANTARIVVGGSQKLVINTNGAQISNGTLTVATTSTNGILVSGNTGGLNFTGGNNRIYFGGQRALEGVTSSGNIQIGEGFSGNLLLQMATEVQGQLSVTDGSTSAPAIRFSSDADTGICRTGTDELRIVTGGGIRGTFSSAGIFSSANVYSGTTGSYRNFSGTWAGTTGTANNGFYFLNTANSNTTKAMELSHDGNVVFAGTLTAASNINTTSGGYQIGGTTVIDASRALVSINSITTGGNVNTTSGGFQINGATVIGSNFRITPFEHVIFGSTTGYIQHPSNSSANAWAYGVSGGGANPGVDRNKWGLHYYNGTSWSNPFYVDTSGNAVFTGEIQGATLDINGNADITGQTVIVGPGTTSSTIPLNIKDNNANNLLRVRDDGVVLIEKNYLYVTSAGGAYVQNALRARGGITNDQGNDLSISSGSSDINFNNKNLVSVGAITANADDNALTIKSPTNATGVEIKFSDNTSGNQNGFIEYRHSDGHSYGGSDVFTIKSDQTALRVLADGLLMFKSGLAVKPATGTGAGTTLITSGRAIQNITSITLTGDIHQGGSLKIGGTTVLNSSRVLSNVTGNVSMFTNDAGYLTSATLGSNLNADTVDSLHASSFLRSDANDTATGQLTLTRTGIGTAPVSDVQLKIKTSTNDSTDFAIEAQSDNGSSLFSLDGAGEVRLAGNVKMSGTTIITSGRGLTNLTLSHGTGGTRFETNNWHYSTDNNARFYFEASGRTFYKASAHQFRNSSNATQFNINTNGHIHIASNGDSGASSTEYIKAGGVAILTSSRVLQNVSGDISMFTNDSNYATQTYVTNAISDLVDSAPSTLDTLNELASALNDDANFSTTVTNSIATKLPLAGGTLTGTLNSKAINMQNHQLYGVNNLRFNDPGVNEGIKWDGGNQWQIYESPDDQSNNSGNLQFTSGSGGGTRRLTLTTGGHLNLVTGDLRIGGTSVITSGKVLENVSGNISMFTNDSSYITNSTASLNANKITSGTLSNSRLSTDMILSGSAPRYRLTETGVTNTPNWWMVADGGNYSIRLNNTGTYPLTIVTNTDNNAVTSLNLGYDTHVQGTIHRGNLTIDSQEIDVSSGDLTLDVAGNINLDAGGGNIDLKEGGTLFGRLQEMIGGLGISAGSTPTFAQLISSTKTLFFGHIELGDDKHVRWGNGNGDLQIYHDGLNSYIEEYGTGDLIISSSVLRPRTDSFILNNAANTEHLITASEGSSVFLYHDGAERFRTHSYGGSLTGSLAVSTQVWSGGSQTHTAPAYAFNNDTNTGMYRQAADTLGFSCGGTEMLRLNTTGAELRNSGALLVGGDYAINSNRVHLASNGSAAGPSFTFNSDTNTGMFRVSSDALGFSTGGTERFRADSGGVIALNGNFAVLKGNTSNTFTNTQIRFGYANTQNYQQAIKTRHNGGAGTGNAIDFFLWDSGTDAVGTIGTKRVASFETSRGLNITHGGLQIDSTDVINSGRVLSNITGATISGDTTITGSGSTGNAFRVNRGNNGNQSLRIQNTGEIVTSSNYLYASFSGTTFYAQGRAVFRTSILNDTSGMPLKIEDDLNITGSTSVNGTQIISSSRALSNITGNISMFTNDSGYITSASLPTVNNGTLTILPGNSLTGSGTFTANQSGNTTVTLAVDTPDHPTTWSDVVGWENQLVKDTAVEIHPSGYLRASYLNMTHSASNRNNDTVFYSSTDSYIRKNNKASFRTSLDVYSKAETNALIPSSLPANGGNADTVDSLHASSFLRSDADDSVTGNKKTTLHQLRFTGVGTNSNAGNDGYAFYQEAGTWSSPFPDLIMGYHTGVKFGAHKSYGGIRFYNDHPYNSSASKIMSVGEGDNNVRIQLGDLYFSATTSNKAWHAGNDGSGSGLDADLLDGYDSAENGASKILRTQSNGYLNILNWINVGSTGLFSGTIGNHFHVETNGWISKSGSSTASHIRMRTYDNNTRGFLYANSSNYIGFLDPSQNWIFQARSNGNLYKGNGTGLIWHSANDGSGSGLDADLLDGINSSSFLRSDADDNFTANSFGFPTLGLYITNNNSAPGSHYIRGNSTHIVHGTANGNIFYLNYGNSSGSLRQYGAVYQDNTLVGNLWGSSNDGSGSGLDADTLDGQHGSYYAPASSIPTVGNGTITINAGSNMSGGGTFTVNQSGNTTITLNSTASGGGGASSSQTVTARVKANRLDYIAATSPATIFTATSGKVIVLEEAICFIDADAVSASGYPVFGYPIRVRVKSQWNNSSDAYIHRDGGMTFTKEALNSLFRSNSQSANYSANMKRFLVAQPRDPTANNPDQQQQIAEVNSSDGTFNSKIELTMDSYVNTSTSEDYYFYFQVKFREVTLSDITGASGMVTI